MLGYECEFCNKTHQMNSYIGKAHYYRHLQLRAFADKQSDIERLKYVKPSKEEHDKKLFNAIFGEW